MELKFDRERTRRSLSSVSFRGGVVFGVGCVERMFLSYAEFSRRENWGDEVALRNAIDVAWEIGLGAPVDRPALHRLLLSCEAGVPHSDDFGYDLAQYAQDAMLAACCLLDYVIGLDVRRLVFVPQYATDALDFYVQESAGVGGEDLERKVLEHPLMQQELARQRRDLAAVSEAEFSHGDWLQDFRVSRRGESIFLLNARSKH